MAPLAKKSTVLRALLFVGTLVGNPVVAVTFGPAACPAACFDYFRDAYNIYWRKAEYSSVDPVDNTMKLSGCEQVRRKVGVWRQLYFYARVGP